MADSKVSPTAPASSLSVEEASATVVAATKDEAKAVNGTAKTTAATAVKEDNRLSNGDVQCGDSLINGKTDGTVTPGGDTAVTSVTAEKTPEKQQTSSLSNNVPSKLVENSDSSKKKDGGDSSSKQEESVPDKPVVDPKAADKSSSDAKSLSSDSSKEKAETNGKVESEDSKESEKVSDNVKDKVKPMEGVEKIKENGKNAASESDSKVAEEKQVTDKNSSENKIDEDDCKSNSSLSESPTKGSKPESVDLASGTDESSAKKASDSTDLDTPKKKKKKKLSAVEEDGTPKETRRSSRQRKPVSYVDDVKITAKDAAADISKGGGGGGGSDIEMIEDGDPLAISDADVKKAQQRDKMGSNQQNVIVIDTNTLLRNQGNLAAAVAQQRPSTSSTASSLHQLNQQINNHSITLTQHASQQQAITNAAALAAAQQQQHQQQQHQQQQQQQQHQQQQQQQQQQLLQNAAHNVSSVGGTLNIGGINLSAAAIANNPAALQNAIAAITGGANAPPGLKNAYITAVQQVLVQQQAAANTTPAGQQYLANLQQYYNTLGALRDEAYVIEAPSFIVPYVMEGKPKESIKDFLKRTNKEQEECEKKEREKKEKEEKEKRDLEEKEKKEKESKEAKDSEKKDEQESEEKKERDKMETDEKEKDKSRESDKSSPKRDDEKEKDDKEKEKDEETKEPSEKDSKEEKAEDESKATDDSEKKKKAADTGDENKENTDDKEAAKDAITTTTTTTTTKPAVEDDTGFDKYKNEDYTHLGRWESYYKSSLGAFVLDLGLSLAQEFIQADLLKMQKRKLDKMKTQPSRQDISAVKALDRQLSKSREKNVHLRMPTKLCKFCNYRTDSKLVMDRHLESPHMVNYTYKCNFCTFETRGPQVILFHMEAEHMVRGRLERAPAFFQCQLCPFEDNNKSKMTRHSFSCAKKFKPEKNCEMLDWEPPAKIPKQMTRGRTLPVGSNIKNIGGNLYDASGRSLLPKGLPPGLTMQQLQTAVAQGLLPNPNAAANAANNLNRGRGRPIGSYKSPMPGPGGIVPPRPMVPGGAFNRGPGVGTPQLSQQQQLALAGQLFQGMQGGKNLKGGQTPSISITALPRAGGASTAGAAAANLGATATGVKTATGKDGKPSFVICEICDGYIKDLEQLRNHMNFIHKVKIHPKMIYNRPPLNCQKCQHRFFTDQGLERHLLGTHGLVTSSMQEAANKSKDAGRCPICGKVFQWKLLNHVARDHKMTLKPAHLSYKCTVCTATFNMYRLFENHVYSAHSVVNKQKDGASGGGTGQSKTNGSAEAPLKINDEITIIPQPTSGKSSSAGQRLLEKKKDGTPTTVSKEITITKVGSAPIVNRASASRMPSSSSPAGTAIKAGSSVEVISLDESPAKKAAAVAMATKRLNTASAESVAGPSKKSKLA